MAIVTKTGSMGLATFSFDFDDVALELIAIHVNNQDTRTFNCETAKGTFQVASGQQVDRNLNPPQREAYTLQEYHGNVTFAFPHRLYFS